MLVEWAVDENYRGALTKFRKYFIFAAAECITYYSFVVGWKSGL
jgi:hypothetical protein